MKRRKNGTEVRKARLSLFPLLLMFSTLNKKINISRIVKSYFTVLLLSCESVSVLAGKEWVCGLCILAGSKIFFMLVKFERPS